MKSIFVDKKFQKSILYIEIVAMAVVLSTLCFGNSLWFDESFSLNLIKCSFSDIVRYTATDVHPPLYYFFLKITAMIFGHVRVAGRLLSVAFFVLMLIEVAIFVNNRYGYPAAWISVLMIFAAPNLMHMATELRMYSLAMLLVTTSQIVAFKLYEDSNDIKLWIALAIINCACAYTHYFAGAAAIIIAFELLLLLIAKKESVVDVLKKWIPTNILCAVLYLPWMIVFYRQVTDVKAGYWIEPICLEDIFNFAKMVLTNNRYLQSLILLTVLISFLFIVLNLKKDINVLAIYLYVLPAVYVFAGIVLSMIIAPIFIDRYIVLVLPSFFLALAVSYFKSEKRIACALLTLVFMLLAGYSYYKEYTYRIPKENTTAVDYIQSEIKDGDIIYTTYTHVMGAFTVYFPENEVCIKQDELDGEKFKLWDEMADHVTYINNIDELKDASNGHNIWVVLYNDKYDTVDCLNEDGFELLDERTENISYSGNKNNSREVMIYKYSYKEEP